MPKNKITKEQIEIIGDIVKIKQSIKNITELFSGKGKALGFDYPNRNPNEFGVGILFDDENIKKFKKQEEDFQSYCTNIGVNVSLQYNDNLCLMIFEALNSSEVYSILIEMGKFLSENDIAVEDAILNDMKTLKTPKNVSLIFQSDENQIQNLSTMGPIYVDPDDDDDENFSF